MVLNTWIFAGLVLVAWPAYALAPSRARPWILGLTSLAAYAWAGWFSATVLLGTTVATALIASRLGPGRPGSRRWVTLGIALLVGVLAFFKYQGLLVSSLLGPEHRGWDVATPLGVSFFTFLLIHVLVEVHRGRVAAPKLAELAQFTAFFPTVVSGPLKRIGEFRDQLQASEGPTTEDVDLGLRRIVVGLARKTIADNIAWLPAATLASPGDATPLELWVAVYAYSLQIYFDFGGYSDMAIGVARLFGFRVPENFDYPYFQTNIARFWRCWHITLTSWITEYLYIPLGGNRRGEARTYANRLTAMTLCGLWHGAAWNFAIWGLYHGVLLNLHQAYRKWRPAPESPASWPVRIGSTLLTYHAVTIGWVFFVCDFDTSLTVIRKLAFL